MKIEDYKITPAVTTLYEADRMIDAPRTWAEMTDAEKGALLLAAHEGKVIECLHPWTSDRQWHVNDVGDWIPRCAYRIRPEPKRETVSCWWNGYNIHRSNNPDRTHRITFDLIDGKPDPASIKMERIE